MAVIPILLSDSRRLVEYKIHLAAQVAEVEDETTNILKYRRYYSGNHDLLLNDDQIAFLDNIISADNRPVDNKLKVVIDKLRGRLDVQGFLMPEEEAGIEGIQPDVPAPATQAEWAWRWWRQNRMDAAERELYTAALRDGYSFLIVSHDGTRPRLTLEDRWDGTTGIRFFWDNQRMQRDPLYAVRYWYTRDPLNSAAANIERITVYTASAIYKYARPTKDQQNYLSASGLLVAADRDDPTLFMVSDPTSAGTPAEAWPIPWTDGTGEPLGIPVIPFVSPRGSIIAQLIPLQDVVNKTWLDLLASADQQGFPIPVISYTGPKPVGLSTGDPTEEQDGLGMRPGRVLELWNDAKASMLDASDGEGLRAILREAVTSIAANAEQPLFNFFPLGGEVPSGAALDELSRPLGEQAEEVQRPFSDAWRDVFRLAMRLEQRFGEFPYEPVDLVVRWKAQPKSSEAEETEERARYTSHKIRADIIKTLTDAGMGLEAACVAAGYSAEDAAMMARMDAVTGIEQ